LRLGSPGPQQLEAAWAPFKTMPSSASPPEWAPPQANVPGPFNGRQIADEARKLRRDLKVLFTTGYAQNAIIHQGRLDPGVQLIVKPSTSPVSRPRPARCSTKRMTLGIDALSDITTLSVHF
jgi:hypothetical protein